MEPVGAGSAATPETDAAGLGTGLTHRLRVLLAGTSRPNGRAEDPLAELIREHRAIHPHADASALRRAYAIAEGAHRGQQRISGEPYITHPIEVARILAMLGMDTTALVAALLHDTVEDTNYTLTALDSEFGPDVATVVDGVTKVERVSYGDEAEAETIRKMIIAAGRDVRVLIVKIADRLHNMRTLDVRSPQARARVARTTRDVLIPLCDRLGIQALKRELEDCVLRYLEPEWFGRIDEDIREHPERQQYVVRFAAAAQAAMRRERVTAEVSPRPRHHYSIWKDTVAGGHKDPLDLPRIVILVDGPDTDCYAALGVMHGTWRPVPGRFKDFIASPKNNLYRSLHTTVIGPDNLAVEVLIRTSAMHQYAEFGIAARFRFPRQDGPTAAEQMPWLRRLLEWEREAGDPGQFLEALHSDLAEAQIQVFTPQGRGVQLPAQATPVDLAYMLDTQLGDQCVGALINGRLVPLASPLADGDVVEIVTDKRESPVDAEGDTHELARVPDAQAGPRSEWLAFVKTPRAQLQISRWLTDNAAQSDGIVATDSVARKVRLGRAAIGLALRKRDRNLASDLPLVRLASRLGYPDIERLLVAVAEYQLPAGEVVDELISLVDQDPE